MKKQNRGKLILLLALILLTAVAVMGCGKANTNEVSPAVKEVLETEEGALESFEPFLRIDNDYADAWEKEIEFLRIFKEGKYTFGEPKEKYNLDLNYPVSTEGLDDLNASASAQFSEKQFNELADILNEEARGKEIIVVDLREESHYLLNGISVSNFSLHNWANLGVDKNDIEKEEKDFFEALEGKTVTAYMEDDEQKQDEQLTVTVTSAMSERELVEGAGFTYLRIPMTDHAFPAPDEIDDFISFIKEKNTDNIWLHFHCLAGKGRTGTLIMLYDKMKNPEVDNKDILYRHSMTYSNYPLYLGDGDSYKDPLYKEKAQMMPLLFQYVEENYKDNYSVSWGEWLEKANG